jgi:hypothetical protein
MFIVHVVYANLKVSTVDERLRQLNTSIAVDFYGAYCLALC